MVDYYQILELPRSATSVDIKKAYRRLALQTHPDKNKDPEAKERFQQIAEAYQVLANESSRQEYDFSGAVPDTHTFQSAEELFCDYFSSKFNPQVGEFVSHTYQNVKSCFQDQNNKTLWDVIHNIDAESIIKEGSNLVKNLLIKKIQSKKVNVQKRNYRSELHHKTMELCLDELDSSDISSNEIQLELQLCFQYSHLRLSLFQDTPTGKQQHKGIYLLDLQHDTHTITVDSQEYDFVLTIQSDPSIRRFNDHDVWIQRPLHVRHCIHPFFLDRIQRNVALQGKGNLIQIPEMGLLCPNGRDRGTAFIEFVFVEDEMAYEEEPRSSVPYVYSLSMQHFLERPSC